MLEHAKAHLILVARRHSHMRRIASRMSESSDVAFDLSEESLLVLDEELDEAVEALENILVSR